MSSIFLEQHASKQADIGGQNCRNFSQLFDVLALEEEGDGHAPRRQAREGHVDCQLLDGSPAILKATLIKLNEGSPVENTQQPSSRLSCTALDAARRAEVIDEAVTVGA
jgi:hypothetical protein